MNLVLTISIGSAYEAISKLTHPSFRKYAQNIRAEFLSINQTKITRSTPHWEKFQIFDLLNFYERIIFIDTDILIRDDSPNLFDIVPKDRLGAFNEAPFTIRDREMMIEVCKAYHQKLPEWDGRYYNTGVMVISRCHKYLFQKPEVEFNDCFWEQGYLNMTIALKKIDIFELEYRFNRMTCMDRFTGEERFASYFIHYAGCPTEIMLLETVAKDRQKIAKMKGVYSGFKKHIYVSVSGGLGDQINAEPSIRFMREVLYPYDDIIIATHFPELFSHIDVKIFEQGRFIPEFDIPYFLTNSLPPPESVTWSVVSNLLCHTTDYCSIALLKRTLPLKYKQIKLTVDPFSLDYLKQIIPYELKDLVLIHPGKHWQSKTLPLKYWQEIIDKLSSKFKVCLIGKDDETRGTLDVKCPEGSIDMRNLLDLKGTIALISEAKLLLSNDSAPIHIAGAFDNLIVVFPTCKHPDHVLPYRNNGNPYYKSYALYKALPIDEFDSKPTSVHGSSAEFTLHEWDKYLQMPEYVTDFISEVLK